MTATLATAPNPTAAFAELLTVAGRQDPYPLYRQLREQAPVLALSRDRAVASRYAECDLVLRTPLFRVRDEEWSDQMWPGWRDHPANMLYHRFLVHRNAPAHDALRRVFGRAFSPPNVAALQGLVARHVAVYTDRLVEATAGGGTVDLMAVFARPLPTAVIGELMGLPEADRPRLHAQVDQLALAVDHNPTGTPDLAVADAAAQELTDYFRSLVAYRRARPGPDLISALAAQWDPTDVDSLVANILFLFGSSAETTTNVLGNGTSLLAHQPRELAHLRAGADDAATGFVTEVLRHDAPVQVTGRWASADTTLAGVRLRRYTLVVLLLGSANRDPQRYPDPDRFDPRRPGPTPLSFGAGPHFCAGAAFGQHIGATAFAALARRFTGVHIAATPTRRRGLALRGFESLPVRLEQAC